VVYGEEEKEGIVVRRGFGQEAPSIWTNAVPDEGTKAAQMKVLKATGGIMLLLAVWWAALKW